LKAKATPKRIKRWLKETDLPAVSQLKPILEAVVVFVFLFLLFDFSGRTWGFGVRDSIEGSMDLFPFLLLILLLLLFGTNHWVYQRHAVRGNDSGDKS
jgi:hypothetical protein